MASNLVFFGSMIPQTIIATGTHRTSLLLYVTRSGCVRGRRGVEEGMRDFCCLFISLKTKKRVTMMLLSKRCRFFFY